MISKENHLRFEEEKVPEFNIVERTQRLFHMLRMVTSPSKVRGEGDKERSVALRRKRKELIDKLDKLRRNKFKKGQPYSKEDFREIVNEGKARDEIAHQYLNQSQVEVNGSTARYVRLKPPESCIKPELGHLPPIVLIPGISNDIDPVGTLAQEIAFIGREVIVIAYPESSLGFVSEEFTREATKDGFKAHADFFKEAILQIFEDGEKFSIWTHSTGGPISAEMLSDDEEFSDRVENAVLIAPSATSDLGSTPKRGSAKFTLGLVKEIAARLRKIPSLSENSLLNLKEKNALGMVRLGYGVAKEAVKSLAKPSNLAKYSLVPVSKQSTLKEEEQANMKMLITSSIVDKVIVKSEKFEQMKVTGKIVVWSGSKDSMTGSYKSHKEFIKNGARTILKRGGMHLTALTNPEEVIPAIHEVILTS